MIKRLGVEKGGRRGRERGNKKEEDKEDTGNDESKKYLPFILFNPNNNPYCLSKRPILQIIKLRPQGKSNPFNQTVKSLRLTLNRVWALLGNSPSERGSFKRG